MAVTKPAASVLDLGTLQADMFAAAKGLKAAQRAKLKADQAYEAALEKHETSRVALNAGVATIKSMTVVANLYAN